MEIDGEKLEQAVLAQTRRKILKRDIVGGGASAR
jgi:hypothetical protein